MRAIPAIQTLVVAALFVGSVALSVGAAGPSGIVPGPPDTAAVPASGGDVPDSSESEEPRVLRPDRVVVYYFHRTLRCDTCLKFEAYTDEALRFGFAEELDDGELEWRVANLDDPGSEHFVDDYHITENSVVVVEFRGGEQREWANLDAIWDFVGDKPTFLSYIRSEVEASLREVREPGPAQNSVRDSLAPPNDKPVRR
jgi:hypothetical protein